MGLSLRRWSVLSVLVIGACAGDGAEPDGEPGVCEVAFGDNEFLHWTLSMSDDAREVRLEQMEQWVTHRFDADGKLIRTEYGGIPARPAADYEYDDHDRMVEVSVFGEPGDQCTNMYDDDDRLIDRACRDSHYTYGYGEGDRIETLQVLTPGSDPLDIAVSYDDDDQITAIESDGSAYAYSYRADGQIETMERDWVFGSGKDGTADIRWTWRFRADGSVSALEQDGTDHNDAPVIDGEADLRWTFTAGCNAIGEAHPWIYKRPVMIDVGMPVPYAPY